MTEARQLSKLVPVPLTYPQLVERQFRELYQQAVSLLKAQPDVSFTWTESAAEAARNGRSDSQRQSIRFEVKEAKLYLYHYIPIGKETHTRERDQECKCKQAIAKVLMDHGFSDRDVQCCVRHSRGYGAVVIDVHRQRFEQTNVSCTLL